MAKEKISILCSVYNGEKYILETLNSCINQNGVEVELIIIDDCSSDNSVEIIKEFIKDKTKNKIKLILNEKNFGFVKSVNKASEFCTGEYLLILGHDDMIPEEHAKMLINKFNENTSFVHCNSTVIDSDNNKKNLSRIDDVQEKKTKSILNELSYDNFVSSTGLIIRTSKFFEVGGFSEEFKNYGEWLLWIKLASVGEVKYSNESRAYYRKHENNISKTFTKSNTKRYVNNYKEKCRKLAFSKKEHTVIERIIYRIKLKKIIFKHKFKELLV